MADSKISALTAATTLADTDELVLASAGASKKITGANLKASIPSGAAGAMTLLSTTTLSSSGTFSVSSISGSYNDLILVMVARGIFASTQDAPFLRLNSDTGSNYYRESIAVTSTSAVSGSESLGATGLTCGVIPAASSTANLFGVLELVVYGYASTTWKKALHWLCYAPTTTSGGGQQTFMGGSLWNSTAAVTAVSIIGNNDNLATGSVLRIYGRL